MTKKEFDAVVNDAVSNGCDRESAEAYVKAGFKIDDETAPAKTRRKKTAAPAEGDGTEG